MTVFKIGRSAKSDIVLQEKSVSRRHAELTLTGDGRYHLTDCDSTYGTFVSENGKWKRIRQAFVAPEDAIMLGKCETSAKALMAQLDAEEEEREQGQGQDQDQDHEKEQKIKTVPAAAPESEKPTPPPRARSAEHSSLRRLAAILAADVVGYSSLMGSDESGTLRALKACRQELFDPKVEEYRGRIFKVVGDGILAEFRSVVDGVRCALDIQSRMIERNIGQDPERRLVFRIGINLGDVIVDDDDIFGDGVNIAARLEGLAEPGGLCVSGPVYDQIKNKLDLGYEDLGEQEVKNIAEPVRVYKIYSTVSGRILPT